MSRRNRKKKQTSSFDTMKEHLPSIDKERLASYWQMLPEFHQKALKVLVPLFVVVLIVPVPESESEPKVSASTSQPKRVEVGVNTTGLSEQGGEKQVVVQTADWQEYIVQSGDTLSKVFRSNDLPITDLNALVAIEGLDKPLSKIKQGQLIRFKRTPEGSLDILQLEKQGTAVMFFRLSDGGFGRSK
ncbi:LysM-like peptidoglycan-binding domain-containing protein [Vibrio hannami]|uniref:LysM-like peptidoglycan-binding domain-containing protein n=1 Tax=Vibrio hannami TaxID=2717094 RepID=UPI00240F2098|nr:LysM-like peptidoglycan-binding domain-containing protein [Vibrio hannami]MDG3087014.1 LysM-like peptidoglycan-binding domain-containing protein [Vibrio hannami]